MVGAGRMGGAIALALGAAGTPVDILTRTNRPTLPGVGLCVGEDEWAAAIRRAGIVLIGTPDDVIGTVAARLAAGGAVSDRHVVLHLSGLLDRTALAPLGGTGAALGSLHPLQTVANALEGAALLRGAFAAVEGDARARLAAAAIARATGMEPLEVDPALKASYHAGAAMISNYTVVLADLARRAGERASIEPELAARMYLPLLRGTVANIVQHGPRAALTGAIRRGDAATVAAHLAALPEVERNAYAALGLVALRLAREAGLETKAAEAVETVLRRAALPGPA